MEQVNYKRPHRMMICGKAKMQILQAADASYEWFEEVDDRLLKELAATLFQSERYQVLFARCQSKPDVIQTEDQLVNELVATYQQVLERQRDPIVQGLNALL
jgi:glutamate-1-semialdehyde aminotransferase